MSTELYKAVSNKLCPAGNWKLTSIMATLLKLQVKRLPGKKVSENEARYPTTPSGMKAFLNTFFARHYFQVQNSLLDYMTSEDFLNLLATQELMILDIGSGPAVASLAITDMLACILECLRDMHWRRNIEGVKINYVLNDTAKINLGVGYDLLKTYFRSKSQYNYNGPIYNRTFTVEKAFPSNLTQLGRICQNIGPYGLINFSYVINPLDEQQDLKTIAQALTQIEKLCSQSGRILILQDKFSKTLIKKVASAMDKSCQKGALSQYIYSTENSNSLYTYSYYYCLFAPQQRNVNIKIA